MFDRFDICAAYELFASHYHGGMGSKEYAIFSRLHKIGYNSGPSGGHWRRLTENAKWIYRHKALHHSHTKNHAKSTWLEKRASRKAGAAKAAK